MDQRQEREVSRRGVIAGAAIGLLASGGLAASGTMEAAAMQTIPVGTRSTVVLVHGSWSGAWGWHQLVPVLEAAGHEVIWPDLPGHGVDSAPVAEATLASYTERVVAAIDRAAGPVVLVGHSMGGAVVSQAAEARPDRVDTLVYLSAYLLKDGESIFQLAGGDAGSQIGAFLHVDEAAGVVDLEADAFVDAFFHDCAPAVRALGRALLRREPLAPLATPVAVSDGAFGRVRKVYVTTAADRVVSPALQEAMVAATPCDEVHSLAAGHASYLAQPQQLAAIIAAR